MLFVGRGCIAAAFIITYIYTPEVYPTAFRATAFFLRALRQGHFHLLLKRQAPNNMDMTIVNTAGTMGATIQHTCTTSSSTSRTVIMHTTRAPAIAIAIAIVLCGYHLPPLLSPLLCVAIAITIAMTIAIALTLWRYRHYYRHYPLLHVIRPELRLL